MSLGQRGSGPGPGVRYAIVCVLVGVAVCGLVGAVSGAASVLTSTDPPQDAGVTGVAFASGIAGLIMGGALGAMLGALSGALTAGVTGGRTGRDEIAVRAALATGATYLVVLTILAIAPTGTPLGVGGWQWVGVLVPAALAAALAAWAVPQVRDLDADLGPTG
ncbi:hypothetical protein ACQBAT_10895 [Ornithinimicrobium sp. Y1847]|uniref:hypothetical protein n=1 Tax=Ornithinimicrobium sp. Y1847 TaxID=3405419 RepID=UPI003B67F1D3